MAIVARTATVSELASSQSISGTIPSGAANGDLLIVTFGLSASPATLTAPDSSWLPLFSPFLITSTVDRTLAVYYQYVTNIGSVVAPAVSTTIAAGRQTAIVQAYTGVDPGHPFDVIGTAQGINGSTTLVLTSVTTVTGNTMLVSGCVVDAATAATITVPSGMNQAGMSTGVGRVTGYAEEARPTAGATGTRTWTESSTLAMGGYLAAIKPASAAAGAWFHI
jgi:hypothetical protein